MNQGSQNSTDVLARRYRPKRFDDLIGQNTIAQTLSLALDTNRLSHAYLLSGLRGSGKTSTARIFSKSLVCEQGPTSHPCESCSNCHMANEGRHIDIIEMDAASSRKIDDIRDLIEQTKYKPASARFKIFIIDEVHMLTKEAFNALLKTLEEPPSYVKFILATTDPLKLPATILSRTQHFRFKRISDNDIIHHLEHILNLEKIDFEPASLAILARSGNGSLRDTLTLLDQAIIYSKGRIDVATVTDMLGLIDPKFIYDLFDAIFAKDTQAVVAFTKQLVDYESSLVIDELIAFLKDRLFLQDHAKFTTLLIERFFRILSESKALVALNADDSFVLSLIFFKMMEALKIKEIDEAIAALEADIELHPLPKKQNENTPKIAQNEPEPITPKREEPQAAQPKETPEVAPQKSLFETLIEKIYDRNYETGERFKACFTFVSYHEPELTINIHGPEEDLALLRQRYKEFILELIKETFGHHTQIIFTKNPPAEKKKPELNKEPIQDPHEPKSMPRPEEVPLDSCVAGCEGGEGALKSPEFDQGAILKDSMVQKAMELFGHEKVTVQNKI